MKCNGKILIIDGGFSKAYQKVTGIAGYTLVYNSHGIRLVEDTDIGKEIKERIGELEDLLGAYRAGTIIEKI